MSNQTADAVSFTFPFGLTLHFPSVSCGRMLYLHRTTIAKRRRSAECVLLIRDRFANISLVFVLLTSALRGRTVSHGAGARGSGSRSAAKMHARPWGGADEIGDFNKLHEPTANPLISGAAGASTSARGP